jgi:hypothetical protein
LLGVWFFRGGQPSSVLPSNAATLEPAQPGSSAAAPAPSAPVAYTDQTGFVPPDLATATQAEVQAIHEAEVRNSAAAPPPASFKDTNGKPKAFKYNDAGAEAEDAVLDVRRQQLMQELRRDPKAFARKYELAAKEVQWIQDGETDFPVRLLAQ